MEFNWEICMIAAYVIFLVIFLIASPILDWKKQTRQHKLNMELEKFRAENNAKIVCKLCHRSDDDKEKSE
jgi:hypothetical protein